MILYNDDPNINLNALFLSLLVFKMPRNERPLDGSQDPTHFNLNPNHYYIRNGYKDYVRTNANQREGELSDLYSPLKMCKVCTKMF